MEPSDLAGRVFGPHPFQIGRLAVADFIDVTGDDPTRWSTASPPGFVSAALFVVAPDLLGQLADRSILHGEQTFTWSAPLEYRDDLMVAGTVSRVRERGGVHFVGFDFNLTGGEESIATGSSLFLVSGGATATDMTERHERPARDDGSPRAGQVSMSRLDLVRYAAATRDFNPIHWDHGAAVDAGLAGVVVHGLAQAAWALEAASRQGESDRPLADAKIRFRNPLLPATPVSLIVERTDTDVTVSVTDGETEYLGARIGLVGR
jgi:acyl dehydratase